MSRFDPSSAMTHPILLAEQVFGSAVSLGAGRRAFVRDIAAQHVVECTCIENILPIVRVNELIERPDHMITRQICLNLPGLQNHTAA